MNLMQRFAEWMFPSPKLYPMPEIGKTYCLADNVDPFRRTVITVFVKDMRDGWVQYSMNGWVWTLPIDTFRGIYEEAK